MCRIFNTVGSLNDIQCHLNNHNINEFTSLNELISFQKTYHATQQQIIVNHTQKIEQEKIILEKDIDQFNYTISTRKQELKEQLQERLCNLDKQIESLVAPNFKVIPIIKDYYTNLIIWVKIWVAQITHHYKIFIITRHSNKLLSKKSKRFNYIATNFTETVDQSSASQLQELLKKRTVIDEINTSVYGAIGEQKVVNMLEKLSDEYTLINDFIFSFQSPLYNRKENDYIKSIQIDHLLVSPSGIFIIETKNWSKESIVNLNLRSPVQQVYRTNFALFKILTGEVTTSTLNLKKHHWGDRKIPIRNVIVFINNKPIEEFQFVKILALSELLPYIRYFTPTFTFDETKIIADFLLNISFERVQSKLII